MGPTFAELLAKVKALQEQAHEVLASANALANHTGRVDHKKAAQSISMTVVELDRTVDDLEQLPDGD